MQMQIETIESLKLEAVPQEKNRDSGFTLENTSVSNLDTNQLVYLSSKKATKEGQTVFFAMTKNEGDQLYSFLLANPLYNHEEKNRYIKNVKRKNISEDRVTVIITYKEF